MVTANQKGGIGRTATKRKAGAAREKPSLSGSDLDRVGGPLALALALIDEDPNQPRHPDNPGFSKESLRELAATIRERHVKTPISVRPDPDAEGRYIINHGARRYRASKIAGKDTIPAFVDADYTEADQVIENLQRNDLTPREIADFIGRELAKGKKKRDIAKELGKSPAFVTQHVTLLDLPEPIAAAFNSGRASDVTVVNELVAGYKQAPEEVTAWLDDEAQELTRGSVKLLREFLEDKRHHEGGGDPDTVEVFTGETDGEDEDREQGSAGSEANEKKASKEPDRNKLKKAIVQVKHDGRKGRLILNRRPPADGWAWLKYDDDGQVFEADLATVQLVALIEA